MSDAIDAFLDVHGNDTIVDQNAVEQALRRVHARTAIAPYIIYVFRSTTPSRTYAISRGTNATHSRHARACYAPIGTGCVVGHQFLWIDVGADTHFALPPYNCHFTPSTWRLQPEPEGSGVVGSDATLQRFIEQQILRPSVVFSAMPWDDWGPDEALFACVEAAYTASLAWLSHVSFGDPTRPTGAREQLRWLPQTGVPSKYTSHQSSLGTPQALTALQVIYLTGLMERSNTEHLLPSHGALETLESWVHALGGGIRDRSNDTIWLSTCHPWCNDVSLQPPFSFCPVPHSQCL